MAETLAPDLIAPRGLSEFSSTYVRRIVKATESEKFSLVLHNCGAKNIHLPNILEAVSRKISFWSSDVDMEMALRYVDSEVILAGNLDPVRVFNTGNAAEVAAATLNLLKTSIWISQFLSYPPDVIYHQARPIENLDAFFSVAGKFR